MIGKEKRKENDPMSTIDVIPASNADKLFILSHGLFRIYEIAQNELFYNRLTKFLIFCVISIQRNYCLSQLMSTFCRVFQGRTFLVYT